MQNILHQKTWTSQLKRSVLGDVLAAQFYYHFFLSVLNLCCKGININYTCNLEIRNSKTAILKELNTVDAQLFFVTNLHCKLFQGAGNYSSQVQFVFVQFGSRCCYVAGETINLRETKPVKQRNVILIQKGR